MRRSIRRFEIDGSCDVVTAFLQGPRIAVRVGEIGEAGIVATLGVQPRAPSASPRFDRVLVPDRTDRDAATDQCRPGLREVGRDKIQMVHSARRVSHDQLYRTCRSRRRELNNSEVVGRPVVDVENEAGLLSVKRERTVDIGHGQRDDLQGEHHASRRVSLRRGALTSTPSRKSRMATAISSQCVSSAKCPVSKSVTVAFLMSRLKASAPAGTKNGSPLPHTASSGGWCRRKYSWNFGYISTLLA